MLRDVLSLDVESLRTLLAVLDEGGMTPAAKRLGMTQSAVSWKVKRLEARVGRPLLIRDGHRYTPTRDGRALIDDARQMVELHDTAAARLATSELTGTVRLGSNEEVDPARMAELLGRFRLRHPGATIEFLIDHTAALEAEIDAGRLDVALIQVVDADVRSTDTVLWSDRLRFVVGAEWASWFDEEPIPLVTFGEHCSYRVVSEKLLRASRLKYRPAFAASSIGGIRAALSAGLGVGVLAEQYLGEDIVPWPRGDELDPLPVVHQVVRTVPGEHASTAQALIDEIDAGLLVGTSS